MTTGQKIPTPSPLMLLPSPDWVDYELLDSGGGKKLERFGPYLLARPEAEAFWPPRLDESVWKKAQAVFKPSAEENGGHWITSPQLPERWTVAYKKLRCYVQISASRHVGVFPEQAAQWDWIAAQVQKSGRALKVLNLFGYTGLASLAAARAGAQVTHLDASKKVVAWAKENQALSGLQDRSIRWIVDDAQKFVQREHRRGSFYDGILLDPPKFGRGPKGEVWDFYKFIPDLLDGCKRILSPQAQFILLTAYAVKASALTLRNAVVEMVEGRGGNIEYGEVVLQEKSAGRLLSMAVFARWNR